MRTLRVRVQRAGRRRGFSRFKLNGVGAALVWAVAFCGSVAVARSAPPPESKLHPTLLRRLDESAAGGPVTAWVLFNDKGAMSEQQQRTALRELAQHYNARAIRRRQKRRTRPGLFDTHDLPVSPRYLDAVAATGVTLRRVSKWVNAVSVSGTRNQFERIAALPFVKSLQPVRRGRVILPKQVEPSRDREGALPPDATQPRDAGERSISVPGGAGAGVAYGLSQEQLMQINVIALHQLGFTGAGVVIGILDTGFQRTHAAFNDPSHPLSVVTEWDFINDDPDAGAEAGDPAGQHAHGTYILGTLGAFKPGELVGAAYDASFILCKTEDTTAEYPAEEDNYVAGLEFIEFHGGDLATSSLGYIDWYTQADLDGLTAVTTVAVNTATANGVYCCTAAGNGGHANAPTVSTLLAPADAFEVLAIGAVDSTGVIASFSSNGPTADGRVKPEILARGVATQTVSAFSDTDYAGVSGTSLSTPLAAGAVACLVQAHPSWTVAQMRSHLETTASDFVAGGTFDPDYIRGYGIINALAAEIERDCNGNGIDDLVDVADGTSDDLNGNFVPDECEPRVPTLSSGGVMLMAIAFVGAAAAVMTIRRRANTLPPG